MQNEEIIEAMQEAKRNFPKILRELRAKNKYTQKFVANAIGVSYQAYQAYERGRNLPKLKPILKLSRLFKVSVSFLLGIE